ncbi:uracil-xanthine permease family protein [Nocardioides imazamoxiresistens]|uniref:uracil-xanthine permease family protein n=1 Tax=Nocardioides imazamoxiresistens TaxID=3231893 RepID=UPI003F689D65
MKWKLYAGGSTPGDGAVVAPDERLSWPRTIGLGAQHVVAMFGATFVFPIIMGLNPQLAVLMSGVATILFLLIVNDKIPSYLGTSAAFVAAAGAIRAQGGESSDVTGAILVAGVILFGIGVVVHFLGGRLIDKVLPPAVTGAVVMLIGFNLAPVVADIYWPADQWTALATMIFVIVVSVVLRGFISRVAVLLGLLFGTAFSYLLDVVSGPLTTADGSEADRINFSAVGDAAWIGLPESITQPDGTVLSGAHLPTFSATFILLIVPGVIALVAENAGHVKAVEEMTKRDLNPYMGRAFMGDGAGTALAGFVGGSPTTTYAENIGVMAATRVYSTATYYVAALVAILFGFSPKFGAVVSAVPSGVLGGITVVLYGMIGLLGAKIWVDNKVSFGSPLNLVPLAAGLVIGIGDVALVFTDSFSITGIALGTIVTIVAYHAVKPFAPKDWLGDTPADDRAGTPGPTGGPAEGPVTH